MSASAPRSSRSCQPAVDQSRTDGSAPALVLDLQNSERRQCPQVAHSFRTLIVGFPRNPPFAHHLPFAHRAHSREPPNAEHVQIVRDQMKKRTFALARGKDSKPLRSADLHIGVELVDKLLSSDHVKSTKKQGPLGEGLREWSRSVHRRANSNCRRPSAAIRRPAHPRIARPACAARRNDESLRGLTSPVIAWRP